MKKYILLCAVVFLISPVFAQKRTADTAVPAGKTVDTVSYLHDLSKKELSSTEDSVRLFVLQTGRSYTDFSSGVAELKAAGLLPDREYSADEPLRKGMLALMSARYLKLDDSVWYLLFGTERYAYTACVSGGVMRGGSSTSETVSGPELIEVIGILSSRMEGSDEN